MRSLAVLSLAVVCAALAIEQAEDCGPVMRGRQSLDGRRRRRGLPMWGCAAAGKILTSRDAVATSASGS